MKTKTLSVSTIFAFLGLYLIIHSMNSQAAAFKIECNTAFEEKSFSMDNEHISFNKGDEFGANRSISSISKESVRTQKKGMGIVKTLYINGNKHKISIKNLNSFSDADDYLSITSPKGHEMTYPLTCHSAQ